MASAMPVRFCEDQSELRIVHLSGPAGIGKTTLVDTFSRQRAVAMGILVAGAEAEAGVHLGNPLYLSSLFARLAPGAAFDAQRLPAPAPFATMALAPRARFPEPVRRLVTAAAVLGLEARLRALAAQHTAGRRALWPRVRAAVKPEPTLAADLIATAAEETARGQLEAASHQENCASANPTWLKMQ